jgi:hypothetical protein
LALLRCGATTALAAASKGELLLLLLLFDRLLKDTFCITFLIACQRGVWGCAKIAPPCTYALVI